MRPKTNKSGVELNLAQLLLIVYGNAGVYLIKEVKNEE